MARNLLQEKISFLSSLGGAALAIKLILILSGFVSCPLVMFFMRRDKYGRHHERY